MQLMWKSLWSSSPRGSGYMREVVRVGGCGACMVRAAKA